MNKRLKVVLVAMLAAGLLLAGCSTSAAQGVRLGNQAPDFQLRNLEGQLVSLSGLRGKPVLINFWASWCPSCRAEMPFIQGVFEREKWSDEGLVILAVNIGESPATAREFMASQDLSFPVLLDTSQEVALQYNVRAIPSTFLIDKDGIIQDIRVGAFASIADIERSLSKIIP